MSKKKRNGTIIVSALVLVLLIIGIVLNGTAEKHETIQEAMKDAVLHGDNKINFFGIAVNPSLVSAYIVTAIILVFALIIRIFVIIIFFIIFFIIIYIFIWIINYIFIFFKIAFSWKITRIAIITHF